MNKLDQGFRFIYHKFLSSQYSGECDVFSRVYEITKQEISKLYPNCLFSDNLVLMQVSHAGFSKELFSYEDLDHGHCKLSSEFLSINAIDVLGDDVDTHFSGMSRAFYLSGVFKTFPDSYDGNSDISNLSTNFSNIFLQKKNSNKSSPLPFPENHGNDKNSSEIILHSDIYIQNYPVTADLNFHDESILNNPDLFINESITVDYCVSKEVISSENVKSFSNLPNDQEIETEDAKCSKSFDQNYPISETISKNQLQFLYQNWMAIVCCNITDIILSLYHNILVEFINLDYFNGEIQPEILMQINSSSFIKNVSFGKTINLTLDSQQLPIINAYFDDKDPLYISITSRMNSMVLDVSGGKKEKGTKVHVWPMNKTVAQKWRLTTDCRLESGVEQGMYLDVKEQKNSKGTTCCISDFSDSSTQKWFFALEGSIVSQSNDNILDIRGSNKNKGTDVILWPNWGGDNQKWDINEVN